MNDSPRFTKRRETQVYCDTLPLRLSFAPRAIREHFEDRDDPLSDKIAELDDETLARIGYEALFDDRIYEAFDQALRAAYDDWLHFRDLI